MVKQLMNILTAKLYENIWKKYKIDAKKANQFVFSYQVKLLIVKQLWE